MTHASTWRIVPPAAQSCSHRGVCMHHRSADETGDGTQERGGKTPQTLADLLATVPAGVSSQGSHGSRLPQAPLGVPYLQFSVGGSSCLLALERLGGVLAEPPHLVYLPYSPEWVLGVFPHRTALVALVDPFPMLADHAETGASPQPPIAGAPPFLSRSPVVIIGSGERALAWAVSSIGD